LIEALFDTPGAARVAAIIVGYLIIANIITFVLFALDKWRAIRSQWRISENTLLVAAFAGGSIGAKAGQHLLRHKTSKRSFAVQLNVIIFAQIIGAVVWFTPGLWEFLVGLIGQLRDGRP